MIYARTIVKPAPLTLSREWCDSRVTFLDRVSLAARKTRGIARAELRKFIPAFVTLVDARRVNDTYAERRDNDTHKSARVSLINATP